MQANPITAFAAGSFIYRESGFGAVTPLRQCTARDGWRATSSCENTLES